jgi:hypothetical protein
MAEERNIELPDVDLDAALAEAMSGSGGLSTKIPTLNELTESINMVVLVLVLALQELIKVKILLQVE